MLVELITAVIVVAALIVLRVAVQRGAARLARLDGAQPPASCRSAMCGTCDDNPNDKTARARNGRPHHRS